MSKSQMLRALVNERLAAAAEDIFVLFERTIAEYEEELCRSKEENQRKQQLLENVQCPRMELIRGKVQIPSQSPGPSLNQEIPETPRIKKDTEEQSVKQEEEQLPESVSGSSAVCVKTEESLLLQQRQTEHREETRGEDISSEPHFYSETEGLTEDSPHTDNDDDWERSISFSAAQMETEADGDHYNQVQIRDRCIELFLQNKAASETFVHSGHMSGADGADGEKHLCSVCQKQFGCEQDLQIHIRIHMGEGVYSCSICMKTFAQKGNLESHMRTHTGEKPYCCLNCKKQFTHLSALCRHRRIHTGEKPHRCPFCNKAFIQKCHLDLHKRRHTGEKPYSCFICEKSYAQQSSLKIHMSTHRV